MQESKSISPGIYLQMSNKDYHNAPGISTTGLKQAEMSVTLYEHRGLYQFDTSSLSIGTAVHCLVLEPEKFDNEIAVMPAFNLRTKAGKEEKSNFFKKNKNRMILSHEEFDKASAMAESVLSIYGHTLSGSQNESSVFVHDPEFNVLRKCRPDSIFLGKNIGDLKTTKDDFKTFGRRAIFDYDYDMQAAWYLDTCNMAGLDIDNFVFIAVCSIKPYYAFGYIATSALIESGRSKYRKILKKIINKRDNNIDTLFHPTFVPEWRCKQMDFENQ